MSEEQKQAEKVIHYRIGNKQGIIRYGENGKIIAANSSLEEGILEKIIRLVVWREAPILPAKLLHILLWAMPLFSVAAISWLTLLMMH